MKFTKSNTKYFTGEDHEQFKLMQYMDYQYPLVLKFHVPNSGKRGWSEQAKMKALGIKRGVLDVWIIEPRGNFCGLVIEMKTKTGRLSKDQIFWLGALKDRGWRAEVAKSFEIAKKIVDEYFNEQKTRFSSRSLQSSQGHPGR